MGLAGSAVSAQVDDEEDDEVFATTLVLCTPVTPIRGPKCHNTSALTENAWSNINW